MNETELERLVVRLVGDSSSYLKMLKESAEASKKTAAAVEEQAQKIQGFGEGLKTFGAAAGGAFAAFKVLDFLKEAKQEWREAETAMFRLNAVIKATGGDVGKMSKDYQDFATEMQKTTTYSDEQVLNLIRQAHSYKLTGDAAKLATKDAMALSKVSDMGAESAMKMSQAMIRGDTDTAMMFKRMIPQLKQVKDEKEFEIEYQKLLKQGQEQLNGEILTGAGGAENFAHRYSDALEGVGKSYSKVFEPVKAFKKYSVEMWESMSEGTRDSAVALVGWGANLAMGLTALLALVRGIQLVAAEAKKATVALKAMGNWALDSPMLYKTTMLATSIALVTAAAVAAAYALKYMLGDLDKIDKTAERLGSRNRDMQKESRGFYAGKREELVGMQDPKARREAMEQELKESQDRLEGMTADLEKQRKEWNARPSWIERQGDFLSEDITKREADYQLNKQLVDDLKNHVKDLGDEMTRLAKSAKSPNEAMRQIFADIGGKAMEEALKLKKANDELIKSWDTEAHTVGMSSREVKIYEAIMDGATEATIENMRALDELIGSREDEKRIMEEAESIRDKQMTPQQKMAREMSRLNDMVMRGKLTWDEYAKAVEDAHKEIVGIAVAGRDAAQFGTGEASARIEESLSASRSKMQVQPAGMLNQSDVPKLGPKLDEINKSLQGMAGIKMAKANFGG